MAAPHHRSHPPHLKRVQTTHARSTRPLASKRHSYHGVPPKSPVKSAPLELDEDTMASFNQYCTYCEKQIVIPSQSILYCSESCRKKDNNKVLSYSTLLPEPTTPLSPYALLSFDDLPVRNIVAPRSPTALNTNRFSTHSEPCEDDNSLETDGNRRGSQTRIESEAARYLRQFYYPSSSDLMSGSSIRTARPTYNRSSTSIAGMSTGAPSLSHSPSSTDAMSLPYTPSTRPLPPRTNPFNSSYHSHNVDLVNPFAVMLPPPTNTAPSSLHYSLKTRPVSQTSPGFAEAEFMSYEKTAAFPTSLGAGSLKQLFRFEQMQAPPSGADFARY